MYKYPKPGIRDYAEPADPSLLTKLEAQIKNYSTDEYQTLQVEALCTRVLADAGFSNTFSFDLDEQVNFEADHVRAYKHLRIALFQFVENGGSLELFLKPQGAHKWIEAQKEVEQAFEQARQGGEDQYVSEVETDDSDIEARDDSSDDGLLLDLNIN